MAPTPNEFAVTGSSRISIVGPAHQPVRRLKRKQQWFKSPGSAQRFLNIHSAIYNTLNHQRHRLKRPLYKEL
jgi:putative transposase